MTRVKNALNSVENSENSTGRAQYKILQTPQKPGMLGKRGPYMNTFNWAQLKNDQRLSAAQKKTVNKILVSLQVPARDKFRNRPALTFNISGKTIAQVNQQVRNLIIRNQQRRVAPSTQRQAPVQMRNNPTFVPSPNNNLQKWMATGGG